MKAIVYYEAGSLNALQFIETDKPPPASDEVLVKVHSASLNPLDSHMLLGMPWLLRKLVARKSPKMKVPGVDVAGVVEAVGSRVVAFSPGDAVFGVGKGTLAEYTCARESALCRKPDGVTFEEAASAPVAAVTALQGLRDQGGIQAGQSVLINGAAGGVGTFAVQIAKVYAAQVTAVCSTKKVELLRSIGADRVIDYTQQDFTRLGEKYDLIFDLVLNHSLLEFRRALKPHGQYVSAGALGGSIPGFLTGFFRGPLLSKFVSQRFVTFIAKIKASDLAYLGELMTSGRVRPVIENRYPLSDGRWGIELVAARHVRGKVLINVVPGSQD